MTPSSQEMPTMPERIHVMLIDGKLRVNDDVDCDMAGGRCCDIYVKSSTLTRELEAARKELTAALDRARVAEEQLATLKSAHEEEQKAWRTVHDELRDERRVAEADRDEWEHVSQVRVEEVRMSMERERYLAEELLNSGRSLAALQEERKGMVRVDVLLRWMSALLERTRTPSIWGGTVVDYDKMGQQAYHVISLRASRPQSPDNKDTH